MFGIWRLEEDETNISRFCWWIAAWITILESLLIILTFGQLCAAWGVSWVDYYNKRRKVDVQKDSQYS